MKLLSSLTVATAAVLFAAGTTVAQGVFIGYAHGTTGSIFVNPGQHFTFRLMRPYSPSGHPTELGVTIGFQACGGVKGCNTDLSKGLGDVLLSKAKFDPKVVYHDGEKAGQYQEFTVTIPKDAAKGAALLGVRRETNSNDSRTKKPLTENLSIELAVYN